MADQQLIIQIQAQIGNVQSQLNAVQNQVKGLGSAAQGVTAPISNMGKVLTASLGGAAFAALERIGRALINFGKEAVKAFTEADSAARQFQNTLTQRGLSVANALSASNAVAGMAVPAGFEPEVIQQAIGNMVIKMNSGANATLGMAVAMDNARAKGMSLALSVQQVSIAALGSLKALRQFGITTNKDVNGTLKDASTLLKEMAQNVKGGLETFMASPLGMIDRMKVSLRELKETIGQSLTNSFAPAAQFVTGFAQSFALLAATSSVAGGSLVQFAVMGIQVVTVLGNISFAVQTLIAALDPANWFNNQRSDMIWEQLSQEWIDFRIVQENLIRDTKNMTPGDQVKAYMKELANLIKGIETGADSATASTEKWMAAFAPLKLLSGSIPNLAKYVGNLSSTFVTRTELKIVIEDKSPPKGSTAPLSPSVAGGVHAAVQTSLHTATRGVVHNTTIASHGAGAWQTVLGSIGGG